ncbi:lanthionine synthetase C family protein [Tissierella carlieri]|uniref:Lanthionine synthetase C family protein n=1 Tax=Tissierella carlieri TaxID=689904 RepID=A0ABT1S934_9FIRM|nr:lanthionine synthetase C family protein [Tissierella carlieri]MCQ4922981.1 lanthionine synthetase C family protein [Tissierella carlieri]
MKLLYNLELERVKKVIDVDTNVVLLKSLNKMVGIIKDPYRLNELLVDKGNSESIVSIYSSICIFIGEVKELISEDIDIEDLSYKYMTMIRQIIRSRGQLRVPLFGGLSDLGYGINSIYKSTGYFKRFIDSFNKLIISLIEDELPKLIADIDDLKAESFDTMAGMAGVASYLLLYKDEDKIRKCIEDIFRYLIMLTEEKEVFGQKVLRYYLSPDNHYSQKERECYTNGSFNLGLSHGIAGPLSILSTGLNEEIEVEGQKKAIKNILNDLKTFSCINEKEFVYWPERVGFDDYVNRRVNMGANRASWCYGSPGIARAMYLGGKAVDDEDSIILSLKAIDGLAKMNINQWRLNSPTVCHGYAGLLVVMEAMYMDTGSINYIKCINKLKNILLNFYKEDSIFGFMNIDTKEVDNEAYKIIEEDKITLLQGSIGVILSLLAIVKPMETNWMKHLLI